MLRANACPFFLFGLLVVWAVFQLLRGHKMPCTEQQTPACFAPLQKESVVREHLTMIVYVASLSVVNSCAYTYASCF